MIQLRTRPGLSATAIMAIALSSAALTASTLVEHSSHVQSRAAQEPALIDAGRDAVRIAELAARMTDAQRAVEKVESVLPQEDQLGRLVADLTKLVEVNSLEETPIRSTRAGSGEPLGEQILQMHLTGDFNGFYAFLLQIEQMPYPIQVRSFKLQPLAKHDGDLQADLMLAVAFRRTPAIKTVENRSEKAATSPSPAGTPQ